MFLPTNQNDFYQRTGKDFNSAFTSFNELTVAQASSLFDLMSTYGLSDLRDEVEVTGTGSVIHSEGLFVLDTGLR